MQDSSGFRIELYQPGRPEPVLRRTFADRPQVIRIGIDPSNDIVLPAALMDDFNEGVRSFHCTLIYTGSNFRIDFEGGADVFVEGQVKSIITLTNPFELCSGSRVALRLGSPRVTPESINPTIVIQRLSKASWSNVPADEKAIRRKPSNDIAMVVRKTRRQQNFLAVGGLLAAFGLALLSWQSWTASERAKKFPIAELRELEASVAVIGTAISSSGAVSHVDIEDTFVAVGTGWLCCGEGTDRSGHVPKIFTNAHVLGQVISLAEAEASPQRVYAIFPGARSKDGVADPVVIDLTHSIKVGDFAQHTLFNGFRSQYGTSSRPYSNVYDVAHIELADAKLQRQLKHRKRFEVGRNLSEDDLEVGIIGYPVENLPNGLNPINPVPRTYLENVVRRTDPFLAPSAGSASTVPDLYAIRAESAGGLSGSPVVQYAGPSRGFEVVGIVFSASFIQQDLDAAQSGPRLSSSDIVFASGALSLRQHLSLEPTGSEQEAQRAWALLGAPRRGIAAACDVYYSEAARKEPGLNRATLCTGLENDLRASASSKTSKKQAVNTPSPPSGRTSQFGCVAYHPGQVVNIAATPAESERDTALRLETKIVSLRQNPNASCQTVNDFDAVPTYSTDSNPTLVQVVKPSSPGGGVLWFELTRPTNREVRLSVGCFPETNPCEITR